MIPTKYKALSTVGNNMVPNTRPRTPSRVQSLEEDTDVLLYVGHGFIGQSPPGKGTSPMERRGQR